MTMLSYEGVSFAYPDSPAVLHEISFTLDTGESAVLVGESGSGKSTLLRCANGLIPHASGGIFGGDVHVAGRSVRTHRPRQLADVVGFVHQDPEAHAVVDIVEHDIAFAAENLGLDPMGIRRRVEEVLDALGIHALRERNVFTLSGGERQRAAIAAALITRPELLVLDEPTSQLDPQGAEDVLAVLSRLHDEFGMAVLLSEHRLERVASWAQRTLHLEGGKLAGDGAPADVLAGYHGAAPVTRLGFALGWKPLPLTVGDARRQLPVPLPEVFLPPDRAAPGATVATATKLVVQLETTRALHDVNLTFHEGEMVVLLGRNGAGKTTLLRALAGLLKPSAGAVRVDVRAGYVPQNPDALLFSATVSDELRSTLKLLRKIDDGAVDRWLATLSLEHLAGRHPRSLSVGERQRVAIAAVAVASPRLLLLDEPTRGLDAPGKDILVRALAAHAASGGTVLMATHDVELAARVADRAIVLAGGEVIADGPTHRVLVNSLFAPQMARLLPPLLTVDEAQRVLTVGAQ